MVALDAVTGETRWTFATDAVKQDKYDILNPDYTINNDKFQTALDKSGGKLRPVDVGISLGCILSSPVIKDGVMYFGSADGNLYALE
jgi:outer membrane protein assembly factor BamB